MRRIALLLGVIAISIAADLPASAAGRILSTNSLECYADGPAGATMTETVYGTPRPSGAQTAKLIGFDVANACTVPTAVGFYRTGGTTYVSIAVLPGTTASLMTYELKVAELFPYPLVEWDMALMAGASDPCVYDPDFLLASDGVLVPAECS